ncbi:MAG TPA: hypothetical protein VFM01_09805 [Nakamurella sp.]|jgi:mercuric ion transport protein|nr:hypothetical protein [Nakamurella sp.]
MPTTHRPPRNHSEPSGAALTAAGIGAALLMIACCAGPALIAAGALGAIGGFLGNPWITAAAALVLVSALTVAVTTVVRPPQAARCLLPTHPNWSPTSRPASVR